MVRATGGVPGLPDRLREAMERRGVRSQLELARMSGVNQATISRILSGDTPYPSAGVVIALGRALGVNLLTEDTAAESAISESLSRFLASALGHSLALSDEEIVALARMRWDVDEEPTDEIWYDLARLKRRAKRQPPPPSSGPSSSS